MSGRPIKRTLRPPAKGGRSRPKLFYGKASTLASGRTPTATGAILRLLYHPCFRVGARGSRQRTQAMTAGLRISAIVSSWRLGQISSGSRTSPTWQNRFCTSSVDPS